MTTRESGKTRRRAHCPDEESDENPINTAAFFIYGFVVTTLGMTYLSAAEDLLSGTSLPSTVLLIASIAPYSITVGVLPNFIEQVPPLAAIMAVFVSLVVGQLVSAAVPFHIELKLVGVILSGFSFGAGDVTFMGLTAYYGSSAVWGYSGGTGAGFLFSSVFYTGMTTWLCVPPSITLFALLALPPLLPLFYWLMEKKHGTEAVSNTTDHKNISYSPLNPEKHPTYLTYEEKLQIIQENGLLLASLFIGYTFECITMQAIVTTLAFPSAPFDPRDHYQYYLTAYFAGEFLGRNHRLVLSLPHHVTRHTWVLALLLCLSLLFVLLASWFRFLTSVYVVLAVVFFLGVIAGTLFYSTLAAASHGSSSRHVLFSRAILPLAMAAGLMCAGLFGLVVEPLLRRRCEFVVDVPAYCFTRSASGWNATSSCLGRRRHSA